MAEGRRNREKTVTGCPASFLRDILCVVDTRKVLVVEDERNIRELVCLHLGLEGYDCTPLADGREAMALAASSDTLTFESFAAALRVKYREATTAV